MCYGGADLIACWLVGLLPKAQAEEGKGNAGEEGHQREEGDGMNGTCDSKGRDITT